MDDGELQTLADETIGFAHSLAADWSDDGELDIPGFHVRFQHQQAFGASLMVRSFWHLYSEGEHDAGKVLARNLLERIYNSYLGRDPRTAVELMVHELQERMRRNRLFFEEAGYQSSPEAQKLQDDAQVEADKFLALLGVSSVKNWTVYERAKAADLKWAYRGAYAEFSRHVHAGYDVPRAPHVNEPSDLACFVALMAPLETARFFHGAQNGGIREEVFERYKALGARASAATIDRP